jgi:hypothetical protein
MQKNRRKIMNTKRRIFAAVAAAMMIGSAQAVTYTWTGAVDGNWTNAANWDANGVPVDFNPATSGLGFQSSTSDRIVINATDYSPSNNVPTLYATSGTDFTPTVDVFNGRVAFSSSTSLSAAGNTLINANTLTTIGDGDPSNGLASLTYTNLNSNGFRRDQSYAMGITVKSDGSLIFAGNTVVSYDGNKTLRVTLEGGSVVFNGTCTPLRGSSTPGSSVGNSWVDFTAAGANFTAKFGSVFADITSVNDYITPGTFFRASTGLKLAAKDNGDGTFTVRVAPPSGTLIYLK